VAHPQNSVAQLDDFADRLSAIAANHTLNVKTTIQTVQSTDIIGTILQAAKTVDLVMLHTVRYRTAGGLSVSEVTTQIVQSLKCSLILLGEPQV
jgi:nucleotide-binding universal stress UspA family protein